MSDHNPGAVNAKSARKSEKYQASIVPGKMSVRYCFSPNPYKLHQIFKNGNTMADTIKRMIDKGQKALGQKEYEPAGAWFEKAVRQEESAHQAWFGLGEVALGIGQLDTAKDFLEHAVELQPEIPQYRQRLGELYGRIGLVEESVKLLREARRLAPGDVGILCSLSGAYVKAGNWRKAKDVLREVVKKPGFKPQAAHYCLLGMACQQLGELDAALANFKKATVMAPRYPDAWLSLGHLYLHRSLLNEAERCLSRLFDLAPQHATTLNLAGDITFARGNFREAANFFRAAQNKAADSAMLQAKLGLALVQCGDALEAIDAMERAHQMGVNEDWILEHLGLMFTTKGQLDIARENLEMAVERQPDNLAAWNTLLVVYSKQGESDKAWQAAQTILAKEPNYVNALINLGSWYSDQARSEEALALLKRVLEIDPQRALAYNNSLWMLVHSSESNAAEVLKVARDFDRNICQKLYRPDDFKDRTRDEQRRLRIGWISSDIRKHAVGSFVISFLPLLDHQQLEIFIYYNFKSADSLTEAAKASADQWREVSILGDEALADLIRADEIDILIDLNGNTENHRLIALARKPAPIQVTWLGFPGTTGMSVMDYIIIPPDPLLEKGDWCSETPWPLPDCYGVRTLLPDTPILPGLPSERLQRPFTFGCLNNFRKVSQEVIRLWSRILGRVPESHLTLVAKGGKKDSLIRYVEGQFERHGVAPERLKILDYVPQTEYFNSYNEVDLGLDPFPFNGGTTGYDSIWMGVPFITWPGDMLVSRMGKAILDNVGLSELVARDADEYVELAVQLAQDPERLKTLRAGLREKMQASPLMDAPRMARNLEHAFREMWRRWCARKAED
jgi:pentatricopeptide repeat protein